MARRSLLIEPEPAAPAQPVIPIAPVKSAKKAEKVHLGAYYPPDDPVITAFKVLSTETRQDMRDMLYEAVEDYLAKKKAARAFG